MPGKQKPASKKKIARKPKKPAIPKRPIGRPSGNTPEVQDYIIHNIELGMSRARVCLLLDISEHTLQNWAAEDDNFFYRLTCAEAECERFHLENIKNAKTGRGVHDWKASAWLLARKWPESYSEKIKQEISGPNGSELAFRILKPSDYNSDKND